MNLYHYSGTPIEKLEVDYDYLPRPAQYCEGKPYGLWISVEDDPEDGWKAWCLNEDYNIEDLKHKYKVNLKNDAKILHLKTAKEIFDFSKEYRKPTQSPFPLDDWDTSKIDWQRLRDHYEGIIISPYQWECRLALESGWYYGWDCSSGCIWDIKSIDSIELIPQEDVVFYESIR